MLIVGSGFSTHNLREVRMDRPTDAPPPSWSREFDDWLARQVESNEIDALLDFTYKEEVGGSSPSTPTRRKARSRCLFGLSAVE